MSKSNLPKDIRMCKNSRIPVRVNSRLIGWVAKFTDDKWRYSHTCGPNAWYPVSGTYYHDARDSLLGL